jgi:hypothetical protein
MVRLPQRNIVSHGTGIVSDWSDLPKVRNEKRVADLRLKASGLYDHAGYWLER